MTEGGLVKRWKEVVATDNKKNNNVSQRSSPDHQRLKPLTLVDLQTSFYILGLGLLVGSIVLLTETLMPRTQHGPRK